MQHDFELDDTFDLDQLVDALLAQSEWATRHDALRASCLFS